MDNCSNKILNIPRNFLILITFIVCNFAFASPGESKKARLFFHRNENDLTPLYVTNGKALLEVNSKELYDGLKVEMKENPDALKLLSESEDYLGRHNTYSSISIILAGAGFITAIVGGIDSSSGTRWWALGALVGSIPFKLAAQNNLLESNHALLKSINKYNDDSYIPEKERSNQLEYDMGIDPVNGSATGYLSFSF